MLARPVRGDPPYRHHRPTGQLARHVERMWFMRGGADPGQTLLLPSGRIELVISLDGSRSPLWTSLAHTDDAAAAQPCSAASLRLMRSAPAVVAQGEGGLVGISFKASGLRAFSLCRSAPGDLAGASTIALEDAWGRPVDSWIERLQQAASPTAMFQMLEGLLWTALRAPSAHAAMIERAVALFSDPCTPCSVATVADAVGLGRRRFEQLFREDTCMTPKAFSRVMRLGCAARLMRQRGASRWTDVAALCHYSDQAHLVRDFRQLAGMTPSAYLALPGPHATCLPWGRARPTAGVPALAEAALT